MSETTTVLADAVYDVKALLLVIILIMIFIYLNFAVVQPMSELYVYGAPLSDYGWSIATFLIWVYIYIKLLNRFLPRK